LSYLCLEIFIRGKGYADYMYLSSIWTLRSFNKGCDICKDLML
jgi:hypothetical protein